MTRVLVASHDASRSGAPRIAVLLTQCLLEQGRSVRVVTQRPGPLLQELAALAPTRLDPFWRVRRRLWSTQRAGGVLLARLLDLVVALSVVVRARPELVYVNSSSAAAYVLAGRLLRRPVVLHLHESGRVLRRFLGRAGMRALNDPRVLLVACSPSVEGDLLALGVEPERVRLVPSIPDEERIRRLAGEPSPRPHRPARASVLVGACGAVEPRKGVDLWLEAARRVAADAGGDRVAFAWIGGGDPPPAVDVPAVEFLGELDNPYPVMGDFDIMTLPSRDDPFPLVVMEAMLLGKPVVAFDVGGVAEQLDGTGVVVEAGDVDAFARCIVDLAADPGRRAVLGERARARAEQLFSRSAFAQGIDAVIEEVAHERR